MTRVDGRRPEQLRPVVITPGFIRHADGSVLIEVGETRVICTATVEEAVPQFLRDTGRGWVTAEYGMLPGSSTTRIPRESARGRVGGRTHEIQRLIGRSLRAVSRPRRARRAHASGSTATSSKPTAARAPRRSPAPTSRLALAVRRLRERGLDRRRSACATPSRRSASASSAASCWSTSATRRTARPTST